MIIVLSLMLGGLLALVAAINKKEHRNQQARRFEQQLQEWGAALRKLTVTFEFAAEDAEHFKKVLEFPMIVGVDWGSEPDKGVIAVMERQPDGKLRFVHESEKWREFRWNEENHDISF